MRKLILIILAITLLFISHINAQEIRLHVEQTNVLTPAKFGFSYQGKISKRRIGSYFEIIITKKKFDVIDLRINGKEYLNRKFIEIDGKELLRNKGKVYVSYRNPKFPEVIRYDTLMYPYPKDVDLMVDELNVLESKAMSLKVTFNNGEIRSYKGSELYAFLDTYGFSMDGEDVMFEIDYSPSNGIITKFLVDSLPSSRGSFSNINEVSIKTDLAREGLVQSSLTIAIKGNEYSTTHQLRLKYGGILSVNSSGEDADYEGGYGKTGRNVDVTVKAFNDSLYEVTFIDNSAFGRDKYLINPKHTEIFVIAYGGSGENGANGHAGSDGFPCGVGCIGRGHKGGDGARGGNGGNGGDITVYYERKFRRYLKIFEVINNGGEGGKGGEGGLGGHDIQLYETNDKNGKESYYSVGLDRGADGKLGEKGIWGLKGKVSYIQMD